VQAEIQVNESRLPAGNRRRLFWLLAVIAAVLIAVAIYLAVQAISRTAEPADRSVPKNDLVVQALALARAGDVDGAMLSLGVAIASSPGDSHEAHYYRGLILAEQGQHFEALDDFSAAIEQNGEFAEAYAARGTTYSAIRRPATALEDFHKAIEINPTHAPTYVNRGQAYLQMGQPDLAMEDFNGALRIDPGLVAAYFNRGVLHIEMMEPALAVEDFSTCLELAPDIPARTVLQSRSRVYRTQSVRDRGRRFDTVHGFDRGCRGSPSGRSVAAVSHGRNWPVQLNKCIFLCEPAFQEQAWLTDWVRR